MTPAELKQLISESKEPDWFNSTTINFILPAANFEQSFIGFSSFFEFFTQQINGWEKISSVLPPELSLSKDHFLNYKNAVESFIVSHKSSERNLLIRNWQQHQNNIQVNKPGVLTYDAPETNFLLKVHEIYPKAVKATYNFIINQIPNDIRNKETWIGILLGYEFSIKEKSEIVKRSSEEEKQLHELKNNFLDYLNQSESKLSEYYKSTFDQFKSHAASIDHFKKDKEKIFTEWYSEAKLNFESFNQSSKDNIESLEKTYEELLRLKKPAEYWKSRADKLKNEGWQAMYWLIGLTLFACITLYILLWQTPEGMLRSFLTGDAIALKWSIIYVTFISFIAFGIRTINKVAFSSFHLSRDAEEREHLTYFYLALIKDANVEEKDKSLIMQALFSRADTGLLKSDSSPTMPGHFTDKMINN